MKLRELRELGYRITVAGLLVWTTTISAQNFDMIGYATTGGGTTGGQGGASRTIGSLSDLQSWASSREKNTTPEVVTISGRISGNTVVSIKHGANITIQGSGNSTELVGVGINIWDYTNVIVKNLKIREVLYPEDALSFESVQQGWVDHCELHSKLGPEIDKDTYDGLLDITKGSTGITVSWCYLHDHRKCSLVGHTNNTGQQEEDSRIRVTYHHNYFVNTEGRNPSLRYGAAHLFNNFYGNIDDYGLAARVGGHAKVENCHYHNVKLPLSTDKFPVDGLPNGYICESGNLFTGSCGANVISQEGCDFWNSSTLPYSYTLDDVNTVRETVERHAGFGDNPTVCSYEALQDGNRAMTVSAPVKTVLRYPGNTTVAEFRWKTADVYDINGRKLKSSFLSSGSGTQGIVILRETRIR